MLEKGIHRMTGRPWLRPTGPVGQERLKGADAIPVPQRKADAPDESESQAHRLIKSLVLTSVCCSQKIFLATGPTQGCRISLIRAVHLLIERTKDRLQLHLLRESPIP
jgi:hypothetical protein